MGNPAVERIGVRRGILLLACFWIALAGALAESPPVVDKPAVIVLVGAPGEEEFGKVFEKSGRLWAEAAQKGGANQIVIGLEPTNSTVDLDRFKTALAAQPKESANELWIVLLGHGTYDGHDAKFNLRGPDLSAGDLSDLLKDFKRPVAVINCFSASAPFMSKLAGPDRVIITATRTGSEVNYSRFGEFLAEAIADPKADLDKDGQTSLLEAYLTASRRVAEFYQTAGRLATEHALLDDNGDGLGTPADWFRGIRAVKRPRQGTALDGLRANQFILVRSDEERKIPAAIRARRDEIEASVERLREMKSSLDEDDYYRQLEVLLLELAKLTNQGASTP
jgi:hypothetical protein